MSHDILSAMIQRHRAHDALGAIPLGFDGRPIIEWIDEPRYLARTPLLSALGDPEACQTAKAERAAKIAQANQLKNTKVSLQEAALDAGMAGDTQAAAAIQAQIVVVDGSLHNVNSDIANLDALISECESLVEPAPYTPPPYTPPPEPPPAPAPTSTKKSDRSWLLLAAAAIGATLFAFKGA